MRRKARRRDQASLDYTEGNEAILGHCILFNIFGFRHPHLLLHRSFVAP